MKVIIVGGVAGGASAAARLRRLDEHAQIVIYEKGDYISYANCGLPYYIGEVITERDKLLLNTPDSFGKAINAEIKTGHEVISLDASKKAVKVKTASGKIFEDSYDKLILCPGSVPVQLPVEGTELDNVFTLWTIPDTDRIKTFVDEKKPASAVVVGGGFIGLEMVENLVHRRIAVSLVELADQVMSPFDFEMAQAVHKELAGNGIDLFLGNGVKKIENDGSRTRLVLSDGTTILTDLVILSPGVMPRTGFLKDSGIKLNSRGGIVVDERMKTSFEDVYAAGDAVEIEGFLTKEPEMIPLAGPANKQGRIAAGNICGVDSTYRGTQGTAIAKIFDLTAASTGLNEKRLKERGKVPGADYETAVIHPKSHASYYPGAMPMTIKLIFSLPETKILGAQIYGYDGVDKRTDVIASAIRLGATADDLAELELAYAPPYSSAKDPVNMAGFVASNIANGKVRTVSWDRIAGIEDPVFLDVREQIEFDSGSIDGAVLIPLGELRSRLSELDPDRKYIVFCAIGLRGYLACRILSMNGFKNLWNLNGGITVYKNALWKYERQENDPPAETKNSDGADDMATILNDMHKREVLRLDACGLSCPGPVQAVFTKVGSMNEGDVVEVIATDPGFKTDIASWCRRTGNTLLDVRSENKIITARIRKGSLEAKIGSLSAAGTALQQPRGNDKTIIVFSGDLDKAIASFIIAGGAAAMGRKVTMFFTFWGLNVLRKEEKQSVKKDFVSRMFGMMMPRGAKKLGLSKMNMLGAGPVMIKGLMKKHNVPLLEDQIRSAVSAGVNIIACRMSMDLMGITESELVEGVSFGGVAAYLDAAEDSDMNLFI